MMPLKQLINGQTGRAVRKVQQSSSSCRQKCFEGATNGPVLCAVVVACFCGVWLGCIGVGAVVCAGLSGPNPHSVKCSWIVRQMAIMSEMFENICWVSARPAAP